MSARGPVPTSPLGLLETQDHEECFVDPPQLSGHVIGELAESGAVHGADRLDQALGPRP
jgi:hypothetical protein